MAIIGDVILKLAADFGEFAKGMEEGKKSLEDFAKSTSEHQAKVEGFINQIKNLAKLGGVTAFTKEIVDYIQKQVEAAEATVRLSEKTKLSIDQIIALQDAQKRTGQTFDELSKYYSTHKDQLDALVKAHQDLAGTMEAQTVKAWADVGRAADEAYNLAKWAFLGGQGDSWALATIKALAKAIDNVGDAVAALDFKKLAALLAGGPVAIGAAIGGAITGAGTPEGQRQEIERQIVANNQKLDKLKADYDRAVAAGNVQDAQRFASDQASTIQRGRELEKALTTASDVERRVMDRRKQIRDDITVLAQPVTVEATRGGGGGGGGRTDDDLVQAQIDRYNALAASARKAFTTIQESAKQPLDDLQRNVTVNQQIDDIVGKLGAKYADAHKEQIALLRAAVTAAETERANVQRRLQDETRAQQVEEQLGSGTVAYARRIGDLDRALRTTRLSTEAYNRAVKQTKEQTEQAALEAKRYDDDLGSLIAGFEHAAAASARANDQFHVGESAFNALSGAIGEGIDALVGKSNKGFAQIAADFLLMVAKMEAAAAASAAIKLLISAIGGAVGGSAATANVSGFAPGAGPQGPSGGAVVQQSGGLFGSWFGRQGGGPVWPGMPYVVGEHGRERFVPNVAGYIEPGSGDVTINNYAGVDVQAQRQRNGDLEVTIQAVRRSLVRDVSRGGNEFANSLERAYGVTRGG